MRKLIGTLAALLLAAAPAIGWACSYETSASTSSPEQLGAAQAPAASKTPAPSVAKAEAPRVAKQPVAKQKTAAAPAERTVAMRN